MLLLQRIGHLRCVRSSPAHPVRRSYGVPKHASSVASGHPGPHATVAIVGSGPAGFYTAQKLIRELPSTKIDVYEKLPVPFGLVRYGVAPDHPEVKNVEDSFRDVAASPHFKFIGNVKLGEDIPLPILAKHYDALIFAYGASKDKKLGLAGEDAPHVYSARAFVGWYNGLPEHRDLDPDLEAGEEAVIVGQGNVALDVARTLLTDVDVLKRTDITDYALDKLSRSKIRHVKVVGRRGPLQASFTIKEVRELLQLDGVNFKPIPHEFFPPDIKSQGRPKRRLLELLQKGSPNKPHATKSWSLEFLLSPTAINFSDNNALESVSFVYNTLTDPSSPLSRVTHTTSTLTLPTATLFRSIGYRAEPIPGLADLGLTFDDRHGVIQHDGRGRASSPARPAPTANAHLYCSGWVKRGPVGVIATTMSDAYETAQAVVEDWTAAGPARLPRRGWDGVREEVEGARRGVRLEPVHWEGWDRIDRAERREGEARGKPREKMGRVSEMLETLREKEEVER